MTGRRDGMDFDREIEALLAAEPSPGFVANVRRRVAAGPTPAPRWWSWRLAPAGAAAALVIVLLWPASTPLPDAQDPPSPAIAAAPAVEAGTAVPVAPSRPAAAVVLAQSAPAPPVVISPADAEAFELLLARVSEGRLPDMRDSLAAVDAIGPAWIAIAPVVIDPIEQTEGE